MYWRHLGTTGKARIKAVLATGLSLTAVATSVVLAQSPSVVVATNKVRPQTTIYVTSYEETICQAGETLRAGVSAIRLWLNAAIGPRVTVAVFDGSKLIAGGTRAAGWYGTTVTVPVRSVRRDYSNTRVCFRVSSINGYVQAVGRETLPRLAGTSEGLTLPGRISIAYLSPSRQSWLARAGAVIRHIGFGRAASGTWIVYPIAALMLAAIALASWTVVRNLE
ncbi:MAG TPA: hypothetical protein VFY36_12315 [Solirubrobacteraceae bacterium]|nr:hypothetical protein [Solirubrobacteraceae bacterium]